MTTDLDVVIVGAGISGIDAAYHLQTRCPGKTFAILEARDAIGGTWDLFRYPGIRSDSDMYTFGFPFRPWTEGKAIGDGASILAYIRATAAEFGIDRRVRFRQRIEAARWSSADARWTLVVRDDAAGRTTELTCRFLYVCAGYYDYAEGYTPELAGRERFRGQIVHPQHWPPDIDYAGKRVIVIGSGATAVTLVPELAKQAAHVTMLQRSPTYFMTAPARDPIAAAIARALPPQQAHTLARWTNVMLGMGFYTYSRRFPERAKRFLVGIAAKQLRGSADVAKHFTPSYNPWDQRLCFVPDGDLFAAIREGKVTVVTDHIATFTERGIALRSGDTLDADLIVTATGFKLRWLGGLALDVDGKRVDAATGMVYKGSMLSDVPNLAVATGYTNASWTLKCDLTSQYVCRVLTYMDEHGYTRCVPRRDPSVEELPLLDFSSGYVQRALPLLPKQGSKLPWKLYQNYVRDRWMLARGRIADDALELS